MKRTHMVFAIPVAILFVLVTQLSVSAELIPTIEMSIVTLNEDGSIASTYAAPCPVYEVDQDGREVWKIGSPGYEGYVWETPEGTVEFKDGVLDPDPMIAFGGLAIDFGAASSFSFNFILPLFPNFNNPSLVSDSFSGSVTNGAAAGGVTVTALAPPAVIPVDGDGITEVEVYTLSDDGGLTWKNVGLDLMPTTPVPLAGGDSGLTGTFNAGPIATIPVGGVGAWTHMRADVNFGLTGGGDIFTFNGAKILVPEPGTFVLALLSLGAFCVFRRRSSS